MSDNFSGDPRIVIDADGADIIYRDGQPVMDSGLENSDIIALFTAPGWPGNDLLQEDQKIGSDFERLATGTITRSSMIDIANAARLALTSSTVNTDLVDVSVANPSGSRIDVRIRRSPPGQDIEELVISRDRMSWSNQASTPASERL